MDSNDLYRYVNNHRNLKLQTVNDGFLTIVSNPFGQKLAKQRAQRMAAEVDDSNDVAAPSTTIQGGNWNERATIFWDYGASGSSPHLPTGESGSDLPDQGDNTRASSPQPDESVANPACMIKLRLDPTMKLAFSKPGNGELADQAVDVVDRYLHPNGNSPTASCVVQTRSAFAKAGECSLAVTVVVVVSLFALVYLRVWRYLVSVAISDEL